MDPKYLRTADLVYRNREREFQISMILFRANFEGKEKNFKKVQSFKEQ
jgi:hypothetical protein